MTPGCYRPKPPRPARAPAARVAPRRPPVPAQPREKSARARTHGRTSINAWQAGVPFVYSVRHFGRQIPDLTEARRAPQSVRQTDRQTAARSAPRELGGRLGCTPLRMDLDQPTHHHHHGSIYFPIHRSITARRRRRRRARAPARGTRAPARRAPVPPESPHYPPRMPREPANFAPRVPRRPGRTPRGSARCACGPRHLARGHAKFRQDPYDDRTLEEADAVSHTDAANRRGPLLWLTRLHSGHVAGLAAVHHKGRDRRQV